MRPAVLLSIASLVLALQSATFAYVVKMESRMTRVETIIDMQRPAKPQQQREAET